jgi:tetratricopeptide (TPR) repeat protein
VAVLTILTVLLNGCADPGPRALLQGDRLLREGQYTEAITRLELAARLLPRDARAWNHLGLAYHGGGRLEEAVKAYHQALAVDRNLAAAHYNLGCLHLEQNNVPAALAALTSYTGLQPNAPGGWTKLGTAQVRARQLEAAEKSLRQALKLDPRSAEAWNELGLAQVQRRRYQDADQQFNAALRAQPDYAPALLNAAIVDHQFLNAQPLALQKYRHYLTLNPQSPNSAGIQQLVHQLEIEIHPPAPAAPASSSAQFARAVQSALPAVPTNLPSPEGGTDRPLAAPPTHSVVSAASRTSAIPTPPVRVVSGTSPPPVRTENPSSVPAKIEVVRLAEEEPIQPARDARLDSSATPSEVVGTAPKNPALNAAPPADALGQSGPKPGFVSRLNPRNWFRSKEKPPDTTSGDRGESVAAGVTGPVRRAAGSDGSAPSARTAVARYRYHSLEPKPGNRSVAERWLAQGLQAQERNRLTEAIAAYRQATSADPSFFDAHYNLGVAAYEAGDLPQCLLDYEYALAINPASVKARFNFAAALQKANYPRDAASELEKLLIGKSSEARAHFAVANLYAQQLGEPAQARQHYLRLLELDPQHPQATAIRYWLENNP